MKILIIMGGFFPGKKYGGPPVSVDNFCWLMKNNSCYIVTRNHDLNDLKPYDDINDGWNERGNCKVLYLSDNRYNKYNYEKVINEIKPDLIYLQGIFQKCIISCLQLAKKYNISVLLAPRGELCAGALNMKKTKKIFYIKMINLLRLTKNIHFQSTSDEEILAIKKYLKCSDDRIHNLNNIPSIPHNIEKKRIKNAGEGKFIFLSRLHPKKNLLKTIKFFHKVKGKVELNIFGSIECKEYWNECQEEIKKLPDNVIVKYHGLVSHDKVHEVFSNNDAFIFPTQSENYGHVIVESLIVGTPVIISKGTTPWDDIDGIAGYVCELSDNDMFIKYINKIVNMDNDEYNRFMESTNQYIKNKLKINDLLSNYQKSLDKIVL